LKNDSFASRQNKILKIKEVHGRKLTEVREVESYKEENENDWKEVKAAITPVDQRLCEERVLQGKVKEVYKRWQEEED
jgi:hypothetical protein